MMGTEVHLHMNAVGLDVIAVVSTVGTDMDAVAHGKEVKSSFDPSLMYLFDARTELYLL